MHLLIGGYLAAVSIEDIRIQKIPHPILLAGVGIAIMGIVSMKEKEWLSYVYALLPGIALLCLAAATKEKVGYGDGMLLLILGLAEGYKACFSVLCAALFLAAFFSGAVLLCRKGNAGTRIPFVPFLFLAHLLIFAGGGV